jgi:HPt (histidine-containing phosphotransfer) domain-containing protein
LAKLSDGSSESLGDEIRRFLAALETTESQFTALLAQDDFPRVAAAAHNLRSQALMVGGTALAQAAWELESDAKVGDAPACHASAQLVRTEIKILTAAMHHYPASLHSR